MELRRLRYFLSIAAEGSLGKASRTLGIAQPALGRQIQLMEAELGVDLFTRVPKGMILTEEGEYLKQALEYPLEQVNLALRNVRSQAVPIDSSLVLGIPPAIAPFIGPRLVSRLQRQMPNLRLKISEGDSAKLGVDLDRSLVDIALLIGVFPPDKIHHDPILREQLLLVVPGTSHMAERTSVPFRDLESLPLIVPGTQAGLRSLLTHTELSLGITLHIALEIDSIELRKQAVLSDLGYTILPALAFKAEAERGDLVGIPITDPGLTQIIRFATRPRWRISRSVCDAIVEAILGEIHATVASGEWAAEWLNKLPRRSAQAMPD